MNDCVMLFLGSQKHSVATTVPLTLTPQWSSTESLKACVKVHLKFHAPFYRCSLLIPATSPIAVFIKQSGLFPNSDHLGTFDLHL